MEVYSKCTNCYQSLTEKEKENNKGFENLYYPICDKCVEKTATALEGKMK